MFCAFSTAHYGRVQSSSHPSGSCIFFWCGTGIGTSRRAPVERMVAGWIDEGLIGFGSGWEALAGTWLCLWYFEV